MWSYPKVYNLGHGAIKDLLADGDQVFIQEKIDGSQFSFWLTADEKLAFKSKSRAFDEHTADDLFKKAVASVQDVHAKSGIRPGWIYRGEYLAKPKHNVLSYDRIPKGHIALFDINHAQEQYLASMNVYEEAHRLNLECAQTLFVGVGSSLTVDYLKELLEQTSQLGGQKIEGVVIKNYQRFGKDGHALMGKHVSEAFKEIHQGEWKTANPTNNDILEILVSKYRTPARWQKAVQHLAEVGKLLGEPKDIGALFHEVNRDLEAECTNEIKDLLWEWAKKHVLRGATRGLPEWYKDQLAAKQFEVVDNG